MGIQDRDYYRNEGPSIFDTWVPRGLVCRWLIAVNAGMFFLQLVAKGSASANAVGMPIDWVTQWLALDVGAVAQGEVWRLLTYAFLHSTDSFLFLHLIFNMVFLWMFGSEVEQLYGRKEFLAIYLFSAILGGVAYEAWGLAQNQRGYCVGASGAVTTMLILCALHFPRKTVRWFGIVPMPIWVFAIFNVLQDVFVLASGSRDLQGNPSRVAVVVHLAGAAFAVAYFKWQPNIIDILRGFPWWKWGASRPRLKLFNPEADKEEPVAVAATSSAANSVDEHLEAKLDTLLEKIAKTGKESLTPKEQEILRQASEMYKRRRT